MLSEALHNLTPVTAAMFVILISICAPFLIFQLISYLRMPGPWGIPLLGFYPFLRKEDFYNHLHELTSKYGDVYTINIAGQNYVYIGSVKSLKEAHLHKGEAFSHRSQKHSLLKHTMDTSMLFMEGEPWKVQRKFFVQSLRETGLRSKDGLSSGAINEAISSTLDTFHNSHRKPVEIFPTLAKQCNDVLRRVMVGDDITEKVIQDMKVSFLKLVKPLNGINFLFIGSLSKYLFIPRLSGYADLMEGTIDMSDCLTKIVKDHKDTFDPDQPPRDFIDLYIRERMTREKKNDPMARAFSDVTLVANLRQAYGDGSYGIALFILSFLQQFSYYPETQDALYEEMITVVGTERYVTLDDRHNLPLMNSAFKEILRTTKFMSVFPSLEANRDTEVCGVRVPKGYITLVNFWAIHHDPIEYKNPYQFDVKRFLPEKGKVEQPVTFGVGKRNCAGEVFVMNEAFLFVTAILRDFKILPEKDGMVDDMTPLLDIDMLLDCKLRVIPRKVPGS